MRFIQKLPDNFQKDENKFYIGIVGSRKVNDYEFVKSIFLKVIESVIFFDNIVIVSGGAKGVDSIAKQISKNLGISIIEIIPDWSIGKQAGILRNSEIVKIIDFLIAIPTKDSIGTYDTIRKAKQKLIPTIIKEYKL